MIRAAAPPRRFAVIRTLLPIALLLSAVAPDALADSDAKAHRERAREAHARGDYVRAMNELEAAYVLDGDIELLFALGQVSLKMGDCELARGYYTRYLAGTKKAQAKEVVDQALASCNLAKSNQAAKDNDKTKPATTTKNDAASAARATGSTTKTATAAKPDPATTASSTPASATRPANDSTRMAGATSTLARPTKSELELGKGERDPARPTKSERDPGKGERDPANPTSAREPTRSTKSERDPAKSERDPASPAAQDARIQTDERAWYADPLGGALVGGGAIAIVASVVFYSHARGAVDEANRADTLAEHRTRLAEARGDRVTAIVAGSIGVSLIALGVWRYASKRDDRASFAIVPTTEGGMVAWSGSF
jgi:tetratricopeptide (TPR) repeat protein